MLQPYEEQVLRIAFTPAELEREISAPGPNQSTDGVEQLGVLPLSPWHSSESVGMSLFDSAVLSDLHAYAFTVSLSATTESDCICNSFAHT